MQIEFESFINEVSFYICYENRGKNKMPYGIVKEIKDNTVVVTMQRQDMCGDCHACEMLSGKKQCTLNCKTDIPCQIGDQVEVSITNDYFLKATYLIYGIPLVGLLLGLGMGVCVSRVIGVQYEDIVVVVSMIIGIGLGMFYIKVKDHKKTYEQFLPQIIGKYEVELKEKKGMDYKIK